jgi:mannose-6-phosphate isomerase-like protein (cupin superfamily)
MDAGELGSRNLVATWVEVPPGAHQTSHSHENAEQIYVVVRGSGTMIVAGDREQVGVGDLVLIPPATDHGIENNGDDDLVYVTAASPPVSMQELYENELAEVTGYDDDDEDL